MSVVPPPSSFLCFYSVCLFYTRRIKLPTRYIFGIVNVEKYREKKSTTAERSYTATECEIQMNRQLSSSLQPLFLSSILIAPPTSTTVTSTAATASFRNFANGIQNRHR